MRESLQRYNNRRTTFIGEVVRKGTKTIAYDLKPTILIKNITDRTGRITADHIWLDVTHDFCAKWLEPGDIVCFDARVVQYQKGFHGYLSGPRKKPPSIDYTLKNQTELVKINYAERRTS